VRPQVGTLGETLERLLPFLVFAVVLTAGWFWFVQPRFSGYLRAGTDTAALEERVRTLQQATGRARPEAPGDLDAALRQFEAQMSADDTVAAVAAALARTVLASAPASQLRSFVIETGDRASMAPGGGSRELAGAAGGGAAEASDPRLALFPYRVSYTPLRVSFESTFEAAGRLLWTLRDLPTIVELRSATLTRGMPLMKTELVVRVFQRGEATDAAGLPVPAAGVPAAPSPTAPRLAPSAPDQGVGR
jgi:hypothetical protein